MNIQIFIETCLSGDPGCLPDKPESNRTISSTFLPHISPISFLLSVSHPTLAQERMDQTGGDRREDLAALLSDTWVGGWCEVQIWGCSLEIKNQPLQSWRVAPFSKVGLNGLKHIWNMSLQQDQAKMYPTPAPLCQLSIFMQ